MRLSLDISTAQGISQAFLAAPAIVLDELETGMGSALLYLQRETVENTPTAMGILRRGFGTNVFSSASLTAVFGELFNSLPYALPVELGTKPHFPPIEPLITWAEVKLGLDEDEAEAAARGIQRKIGRFGTPGYGMARHALIDGRSTIEAEFADALMRIHARVAGGEGAAS